MLLQKLKAKENHLFYIALLLIVAIVVYWQISFLKYSVTHDMINCWIPWRYYISNCIQEGVFPFWNPYQQLGYPIHADLQGPTWYIESILVSLFTEQNNYVVQWLYIFYVFIAGVGMYFLSYEFHQKKIVSFITAVCYMGGGFFVAHVMHFYAIIGAAWLPFIILHYYKMHLKKSYLHALYASIFMFFNLTGGNHTFSIILLYLFLFISGYFIFTSIRNKNKSFTKKYFQLNFLFFIATTLMACVVICAYLQTAPFIERLNGLTFNQASFSPLSPQSLLSFIVPFSTVNGSEIFNTDPSMCNTYVGIIMFAFIILSLVAKKTKFENVLLAFAFICLFASLGAYTPVYKLLYDYAPLINKFRFPSYFSLFSVIIFLIIGSKQIADYTSIEKFNKTKIVLLISVFVLGLFILFFISLKNNTGVEFFFTKKYATIFEFLNASSFYQNIIFQSSIQIIILLLFLITIISKLKKYWIYITVILVVADIFISVNLNIGYVGCSAASPKELKEYLATLPKNFPIPSDNNIIENTESIGQKHGLYRNTSGFHKRISSDVFNSYAFKGQVKLIDSFPQLYKEMQRNKLFYFSESIYSAATTHLLDSSFINNNTLVFNETDYLFLSKEMKENGKDSSSNNRIRITSFSPNKIELIASSNKVQMLTLLQSYYTGWGCTIDGKESKIYTSNFLTMSVLFPKGEHTVIFEYKNNPIIICGIISYATFLLIMVYIILINKKKNRDN